MFDVCFRWSGPHGGAGDNRVIIKSITGWCAGDAREKPGGDLRF